MLNIENGSNADAQHITMYAENYGHITGCQLYDGSILGEPHVIESARQGGILPSITQES